MATWWVARYNTRRRHSAIGNITPITGQGPPRLTLNTQQPKRLPPATETLKT